MSDMNILGVDPGLQTTGYGVIRVQGNRLSLLEGGTIQCGSSSSALEERLASLYEGLNEALSEYRPGALALEEVYSHYAYPATAVIMGHARGVICLAAAHSEVPVFSYASTRVKQCLAGNGRAAKAQVQRAIQARLGLSEPPEPDDVSDALALAICHWQMAAGADMTLKALASTRKRQH